MFSPALADAMTQGLVASFNPMNAVLKQAFEQQNSERDLDLDRNRRLYIQDLRSDLKRAKKNGEDKSVVDGIRRQIAKHTGAQ